jgi:hypothetical protein
MCKAPLWAPSLPIVGKNKKKCIFSEYCIYCCKVCTVCVNQRRKGVISLLLYTCLWMHVMYFALLTHWWRIADALQTVILTLTHSSPFPIPPLRSSSVLPTSPEFSHAQNMSATRSNAMQLVGIFVTCNIQQL